MYYSCGALATVLQLLTLLLGLVPLLARRRWRLRRRAKRDKSQHQTIQQTAAAAFYAAGAKYHARHLDTAASRQTGQRKFDELEGHACMTMMTADNHVHVQEQERLII